MPTAATAQRHLSIAVSPSAERELVAAAVRRAQAGDLEAVGELYRRYGARVHAYARRLLRDEHEAEDITQAVFAKLLDVLPRYEDRGVSFSSWILRITHNAVIDHVRRRRAVPTEDVQPRYAAQDDRALDCRGSLAEALAELPDEQRQVVVLRHLVGLSPAEIAVELQRSESAVHGLHHRGRRALKAALVRLDAAPMTAAA